jgi:acylphosphatase
MGAVQGVGFRYFAYRLASQSGLTGWVRNLPDGRVQLVAEGQIEPLERLARELQVGPSAAAVSDVDIKWSSPTGTYKNFEIQ